MIRACTPTSVSSISRAFRVAGVIPMAEGAMPWVILEEGVKMSCRDLWRGKACAMTMPNNVSFLEAFLFTTLFIYADI